MGRGFLAGISWGALVGALTIALASQLTERRTLVPATPQTAAVEVPGGSEFNRPPPETEPVLPEPDAPPTATAPATVAAPEPAASPPAAPETAPAPEVTATAPAPAPEAAAPEAAGVSAVAPAPAAAPQPAPEAPAAPAADTALAALPERSPVTPPAEIAQPAAPTTDAAEPAPAAADVPPAETGPAPAPAAPAAPPAAVAADVTPPAPPEVPEAAIALSPPADAAPGDTAAPPPAEPPADALPATAPEAPGAPPAEPRAADAPTAPAPPAGEAMAPDDTGLPTPGFAGAEGVRVNRLPTIGEETPADPPAETEAAAEEPAPDPDAPALLRFAVPFENPDLRPVVALVLLHARPVAPGAETGLDLPLPVSFAVDAGLVEAGTVADAYRAAGREVLLVPTLPPGAAATDVEVALQVNLDVIPEAVALMDLPEGGFQSERVAVAQVVASISATGHGLVTFPRGLNMAEQMASRAGVPTRAVFRVLEAGDTDAVLRLLDQAAFRARQEGAVILVGEAEPATVEAVRRWTEANPDADILFAPISAALAAGE